MEILVLGILSMVLMTHGQNISKPDLLVPNYDNVEHKLKGFQIRQPLVLHCNITQVGEYKLIWEKQGKEVSEVDALHGRYAIIEAENKFIIDHTVESDAGHYSCRVNTTKKEIRVVASVYVRTPSNIGVFEAEIVSIPCEVVGTRPKIYWEIGNVTIHESTDKFILKENENGIDNGVLKIQNITFADKGEYRCVGKNILTDLNITSKASDSTTVRVKDKYAALWPALGIAIEVVFICVMTIFIVKCKKTPDLDLNEDD